MTETIRTAVLSLALILVSLGGVGACHDDAPVRYVAHGDAGSEVGNGDAHGSADADDDSADGVSRPDPCAVLPAPPECNSDRDGDGFTGRDDCDDGDPEISPDADEVCDGLDNDCDGLIDEDAIDSRSWYPDLDHDGYGAGAAVVACAASPGSVATAGDCDDRNAGVNPGTIEVCGNAIDEDCDGAIDNPHWFRDADADGYGDPGQMNTSCERPDGFVASSDDCDDAEALANPGLEEICSDGIDNDCDGQAEECTRTGSLSFADADAVIEGEWDGDQAGARIAAGGDLNGDGRDDVAFIAPGYRFDDGRVGAVYVFDGPVVGTLMASEASAIIGPSAVGDSPPAALSIGDVSGDGVADLIVGVPGDPNASVSTVGDVYVFVGPLSGEHRLSEGIRLSGVDRGDMTGSEVNAQGDFNGDGIADLLIFASDADTTERLCCDEGVVYVVHGPILAAQSLSEAEGLIESSESVRIVSASIMDANGDAFDDVVLSLGGGDDVAVFFGPITGHLGVSDASFRLPVPGSGGRAAAVGDLTGDDVDDLWVAAEESSLILGGPLGGDLTASDASVNIRPPIDGARAGDFNGDGVGDLVLGDSGGGSHGVFYGPLRGPVDGTVPDLVLNMVSDGGEGRIMAAGDINGDGIGDLVAGDDEAGRSGLVSVFYGRGL